MEMKIMYAALMALAGWFFFYICMRQLIFDFTVGYPLIKKFGAAGDGIFAAQGANRLNTISVIIWALICAALLFVVIRFCSLYLLISFFVGFLFCLAMFAKKLGPDTKSNFDAFCRTYCRFVPDDDLRAAMNDADLPKIHAALRTLGSGTRFDVKKA